MAGPDTGVDERHRSGRVSAAVENGFVPDERTGLLDSHNGVNYSSRSAVFDDEDTGSEIDPNEFDNILARVESRSTGLGTEPPTQETAMLRGPRKFAKTGSRRSSCTTLPGKGFLNGMIASEHAIGEDEPLEEEQKSPFLAGVSVRRFRLIFTGTLIIYFVACFDSTIMVSTHPLGKQIKILEYSVNLLGSVADLLRFDSPAILLRLSSISSNECQ